MSYFNPQIVLISNLCLFLKNKWNKGAFPVIECINVLSVFGNKSVCFLSKSQLFLFQKTQSYSTMSVRNSNCNLGSFYTNKILHISYFIVDDIPNIFDSFLNDYITYFL